MVLMISSILRRAATPLCWSCRKASCAAAQASLASGKTPNLPRKPGVVAALRSPQPHEEAAGAGAGLAEAGAPPRRPMTSATMSRIKASLGALIVFRGAGLQPAQHSISRQADGEFALRRSCLRVVNLFSQPIHHIHDADDDGVDGDVLESGGESGAAALAEEHHLADAGANAVHGHDGVHAGTKFRGVFLVDQLRAQQEQ